MNLSTPLILYPLSFITGLFFFHSYLHTATLHIPEEKQPNIKKRIWHPAPSFPEDHIIAGDIAITIHIIAYKVRSRSKSRSSNY